MTVFPVPPGDNIPLIEGLGSDWNDIVNYIPEDKRSEFAPKFKERIHSIEQQYEPLKQWDEFQKSGITPEFAGTAVQLFNMIENDPKAIYETLGNYLGVTPSQAKEVVEEIQEGDQDDPRIKALQDQVETLAQIAIAERKMTAEQKREAEADRELEEELGALQEKYGDSFPEDEILMRMHTKGISAEDAYSEYTARVSEIQKRRPSPFVMGAGGAVPVGGKIDVTKLDNKATKSLVAQMLDHANAERSR